jgi:hypothetical protein
VPLDELMVQRLLVVQGPIRWQHNLCLLIVALQRGEQMSKRIN